MSWSTIRKATAEDAARLEAVYRRFEARWGLHPDNLEHAVMGYGSDGTIVNDRHERYDAGYLARLLRRNIRRALGDDAEGIAYGYVGFHVD